MIDIVEVASSHNWNLPTVCPRCGTKLVINSSGFPECPNDGCIAKTEHQFRRFFDLLDIKAAGPAFIGKAADACKSVPMPLKQLLVAATYNDKDLFNEWASGINGEKVLKQLRDFLWTSDLKKEPKEVTTSMLCAMLDWPGLSVKQFDKIPNLSLANALNGISYVALIDIPGIGNETADEMTRFWSAKRDELLELSHFFEVKDPDDTARFLGVGDIVAESSLPTICFTGACPGYSRKELAAKCAGKYVAVDSVTKDTDILACADPSSGSSKLQKARKNGTKVISYDELLRSLDA